MSNFADIIKGSRGYTAFTKKEEDAEERQKTFVNRFYLKAGSDAKIIFLDDDPPILEEHQLKINGNWLNWFTCRRILGEPCVICDELRDTPSTVGFYTILDLSEYTNKKGEIVKNRIKLFTPKFKALQVIKRHSQKRGGLELCVYDVYRSSAESFNVGDDFQYETKTTWDEVKKLNPDAEPFNYAELLAPKSDAELRRILKQNTENTVDSGVSELDESQVDF